MSELTDANSLGGIFHILSLTLITALFIILGYRNLESKYGINNVALIALSALPYLITLFFVCTDVISGLSISMNRDWTSYPMEVATILHESLPYSWLSVCLFFLAIISQTISAIKSEPIIKKSSIIICIGVLGYVLLNIIPFSSTVGFPEEWKYIHTGKVEGTSIHPQELLKNGFTLYSLTIFSSLVILFFKPKAKKVEKSSG